MRLSKFSFIIALLVFSVIFSEKVIAETLPAQEKSESKTIVLAKVNVQDASIVSQEENTLVLSFNINNREGAQSGVKYGVRLVEKIGNQQKTIDEFVYPEILSIPTNSNIPKTIKYTAPASIDGTYYVYISARNYSGLPLGSIEVGKATFTKQLNTVEILAESCSTEIVRAGSVIENNTNQNIVSKEDKIILSCYIKNNLGDEVLTSPIFETRYRTLYGDEVPQLGGDISPVLLRPLEEKLVSLTLPKIVVPQSYITKIYFKTNGVNSNHITMAYTVSGLSATIQNVSLDKNSYKANEEAKISFFWTSSATKREELTSITLEADIVNNNKRSCIDNPLNTQLAGVGFIEIPVTISKACDDPEVTIALLDATGKVLDQKALTFEANEETNLFAGKTGIIAIIVILVLAIIGLAIYLKNMKKKNKDNNNTSLSGHIEGTMIAILFALALSFIPGGTLSADTIYLDSSGDCGGPRGCSVSDEYMILNINMYQSTYEPGEPIYVYSAIGDKVPEYSNSGYFLWATFNGVRQKIVEGDQQIGYIIDSIFTAQQTPGSYSIDYDGYVYGFSGIEEVYFSGSLPFTVVAPVTVAPMTVEITANNTPGEITIKKNDTVDITWSVRNSDGATCYCTYDGNKSCGEPSVGNVENHLGYTNIKIIETTVFKLECRR